MNGAARVGVAGALLGSLVLGAVGCGRADPEGPSAASAAPEPAPVVLGEEQLVEVTLFFLGPEGKLRPETRRIVRTADVVEQAKQVVVQLIEGPEDARLLPVIPPETWLRQLYLRADGTAVVDFSEHLAADHPGGVLEEMATLYAIVDALTYNFPEPIRRVVVLVDGQPRDTLAGHLTLTSGYRLDLSRVELEPLDAVGAAEGARDAAPFGTPAAITEEESGDGPT